MGHIAPEIDTQAWTPEKLAEWETALRSGEYPMAIGVLATSNKSRLRDESKDIGYCCLGVACEVLDIDSLKSATENVWIYFGPTIYGLDYSKDNHDYSDVSLPHGVRLPFNGGASGDLYHTVEPFDDYSELRDTETAVKDREGYTVSLASCNDFMPERLDSDTDETYDRKRFTQDQLADLVHFFFVVPAQPDGPVKAYAEAKLVEHEGLTKHDAA